ncbi:hypothetical protein GGE16_004747 [Rhizobium leguminosarum]|uniref:DUF5666 domain-containing protein n=1 Tax=Rhizobium leguminosarum TaxID=384 RepID=A0AAE2MMZ9_RHILE|nr:MULTISPECIES: hypothetical protein [Rhizobium]MBB4292668.1 hypothetical protein [Rhizobium leguminosarum]MBB4298906.1 hypothetical protein [Rhizobium leguminosarum]MBB4310121.1 hypothetical protein [Rhizobium leguminosarum]MBB4434383.1 hypothetical protein [Rhizobium esperanzae]MBB4531279.1 hypothetical protein [Rhizobium leguminosarum]
MNELKVRTRDGKDVGIKIGADTKIASVMLTDLSAIKPDSYIGTAAAPQADGTLKALEVHIFPPSMRGVGEGSGPWDMQPNSTMTNGSVGSILGADGRTLTVKYESGEKKVFIPADVPIVSIEPADRSVLKIGAKVLLLAAKAGDESLSAFAVNVGANGIAPPM